MELLEQVRVSFIGIPDAGKSTLISSLIKHLYNKVISTDTLMNEVHYSNGKDIYGNDDTRTIRAAKILCPYKDYELMLIDCPGHIEYMEQIKQGLDLSTIIVCLLDCNRIQESKEYIDNILKEIDITEKHILHIYTHAEKNDEYGFESNIEEVYRPLNSLLDKIDLFSDIRVNVEEEAKQIAKSVLPLFDKKTLMFSGGKDSIVGYDICMNTNQTIKYIWPNSGFDFPELVKFIKDNYVVEDKRNLPPDMNYENSTVFQIHEAKGAFNNEIENESDLLIINYRASDEGVRSKDHYIKMGTKCHRFSPVFYFSEENIWRYICKYNLEFPSIYFKGYRSLGDEPVTIPSMPKCEIIEEIIDYVHSHPFEERDGRKAQDNSVDFGMEKLRNKGFF
jgi:3'-phosphoadenosine 5'-phosphosulfate sulfotransferase (PAPS reductase)/FAD synthetase